MSKKYALYLIIFMILAFIVLRSPLQTLRINRRIAAVLDFPEHGYVIQHPSFEVEATITIRIDEQDTMLLRPVVTIYNVGPRTLKRAVVAAQLPLEIASFTELGWSSYQTYAPTDLQHGLTPPSGVTFGTSMRLLPLSSGELGRLKLILEQPVKIKLLHDDGIELLLVKPIVVVDLIL